MEIANQEATTAYQSQHSCHSCKDPVYPAVNALVCPTSAANTRLIPHIPITYQCNQCNTASSIQCPACNQQLVPLTMQQICPTCNVQIISTDYVAHQSACPMRLVECKICNALTTDSVIFLQARSLQSHLQHSHST